MATTTLSPVLKAAFEAAGVGLPQTEFRFHPKRKWRLDFSWPEHKLALEIEGGVWSKGRHVRGQGFLADMAKYNAAACLGWRIVRATPKELASGEVVRLVQCAILGMDPEE